MSIDKDGNRPKKPNADGASCYQNQLSPGRLFPSPYLSALHTGKDFYALSLLRQNRTGRVVALCLLGLMFAGLVAMFLPWQQNIRANGFVTALHPGQRPQMVYTTIAGRIEEWYVAEGDTVTKGQPIMRISEVKDKYFDPKTLERLEDQLRSKVQSNTSKVQKADALTRQIEALNQSLAYKREQLANKIDQGIYKVKMDSAGLSAAQNDFTIAETRLKRNEELHRQGLISLNKLEEFRLKFRESQAKLEAATNKLASTRNELVNARIDLSGVLAEYTDKISKAESDRNQTLAELNDGYGSAAKLENELSSTEIRFGLYTIRAPQDGRIIRALKAGLGENIKEGEPVVTIMPKNYTLAVEMYVHGNDVPLLSVGRKVRLEFDGWPAMQFSGWPSVAVGTFGGEIKVIDMVNSKDGTYRVLVSPDPAEEPWPNRLRMGSGVLGWAMLDEVPVWFEIWRNLNGFPPSLQVRPENWGEPEVKETRVSGPDPKVSGKPKY